MSQSPSSRVMHLQQNLSFPLKIKPPHQAGGSENSLKRWVYLSLSHEFVTTQLSVVILESLALAIQELPSSAKAEYLSLMYPNWRQILTFAGWGGRITHLLSITKILNCTMTFESEWKITLLVHLLQGLESGDYTKREHFEDKDKPPLTGSACRIAVDVNHKT